MPQSEDCLTLNVWTPEPAPSKPAPVLYFIHGGGDSAGSGGEPLYDGQAFASETGLVVVTVNYRLGAFGFLAHPALSAENPQTPGSGNYALQDQRAGMQWVKRNIAALGGDPNNVTIYGESGGGGAICWHVASPLSKGLFHRAIISSGSCELLIQQKQRAEGQGSSMANELGCKSEKDVLACLRSKTAAEIVEAGKLRPGDLTKGTAWGPVIDGVEVSEHPKALLDKGIFNRVPVITGATKDEGSLLAGVTPDNLTVAQFEERVKAIFPVPALSDRLLSHYKPSAYGSPKLALFDFFTDSAMACPVRRVARAISKAGMPTYRYSFDHVAEYPKFRPGLGAFHASELSFIFGNPIFGLQLEGVNKNLSKELMRYWAQFATTGDPNGGGLLNWPKFDAKEESYLSFGAPSKVMNNLKKEACDIWDSFGA
jgi:para-nitrobenzyl esterase